MSNANAKIETFLTADAAAFPLHRAGFKPTPLMSSYWGHDDGRRAAIVRRADGRFYVQHMPAPEPRLTGADVMAMSDGQVSEACERAALAAGWQFDDASHAAGEWAWYRVVSFTVESERDERAVWNAASQEWRFYVETAAEALSTDWVEAGRPVDDDDDDGCPVSDPDCMGGNGDCHDACEAPSREFYGAHGPGANSLYQPHPLAGVLAFLEARETRHRGEAKACRASWRHDVQIGEAEAFKAQAEVVQAFIGPARTMVPQPAQQQQAKARASKPARGERRYVEVRDTETGEVHRVLTSVARVGVAVVIFVPSNRHREGALNGMLITHDDTRKAWVFNDEAEARRLLSCNRAPGERVIRAELVADPAPAESASAVVARPCYEHEGKAPAFDVTTWPAPEADDETPAMVPQPCQQQQGQAISEKAAASMLESLQSRLLDFENNTPDINRELARVVAEAEGRMIRGELDIIINLEFWCATSNLAVCEDGMARDVDDIEWPIMASSARERLDAIMRIAAAAETDLPGSAT